MASDLIKRKIESELESQVNNPAILISGIDPEPVQVYKSIYNNVIKRCIGIFLSALILISWQTIQKSR